MSAKRWVWVVMGNDFPDSAFSNEQAADNYCQLSNAEAKERFNTSAFRPRIYYRWYKMEVKR